MRIATLTLLALSFLGAPSAAGAAGPEPPFCERTVLHDYLTPLKRVPKLRELPFRRAVESSLFHGVEVSAAGPTLAVNGGRAGYQLQWDANPRWDVTVALAKVNRGGEVIRPLGQRHLRLGQLAPALITEPGFTMPGKPALYRTTLTIRSPGGRKLAEFGNYYRVVRPTVHVRLASIAPVYRPGTTLYARVENLGTAIVLSDEESAIEKREGESWVPVPESPGLFAPLYFVAPGATGSHCTVFPIPTSMAPGRYRLSQEAVISWPFERRERRPTLRTEFEVSS